MSSLMLVVVAACDAWNAGGVQESPSSEEQTAAPMPGSPAKPIPGRYVDPGSTFDLLLLEDGVFVANVAQTSYTWDGSNCVPDGLTWDDGTWTTDGRLVRLRYWTDHAVLGFPKGTYDPMTSILSCTTGWKPERIGPSGPCGHEWVLKVVPCGGNTCLAWTNAPGEPLWRVPGEIPTDWRTNAHARHSETVAAYRADSFGGRCAIPP